MPDAQGTLTDGGRGWKVSVQESFGWLAQRVHGAFSSKKRVRTGPTLAHARLVRQCFFVQKGRLVREVREDAQCALPGERSASRPACALSSALLLSLFAAFPRIHASQPARDTN